jgi:[glutamine synthetase] adenylyltransferase / [glutamine synthetase]-adenylyl-L-tyrosine phosphorylase
LPVIAATDAGLLEGAGLLYARYLESSETKSEIKIAGLRFRDPKQGYDNLALIGERVPDSVAKVIPSLLREVPDPDTALNLLERLTAASPDTTLLFAQRNFLIHYALVIFGYSQFLGETLVQNRDLFHALMRDKGLGLTRSREELHESFARFRSRSLETDMSVLLARYKRREYVRILLRDVLEIAKLAETTAEISALADVLVEEAFREAYSNLRNRYGAPQHTDADGRLVETPFTVLSMGKLGGNELNYSSDIDLLFLYSEEGEAAEGGISNHEFFIRLAQQITETLSRHTREGAAFRVDLRLRPQGGEGEPAVGLEHAIQYYAGRAADWERQALIKVRHCAADQKLAREFIRRVQPYVYTEKINFAAIETAIRALDRIGSHRRHQAVVFKETGIDVKVDRGGIRDVEFLVQCLQRVYGGTELWLRSGGTLFSLQKLHDKGHISGKEYQALSTAYEFLRKVEHRLQLRRGQQTHRLPEADDDLRFLYRASADDETQRFRPKDFVALVEKHMKRVAEIYSGIIHHQQAQQQEAEIYASIVQEQEGQAAAADEKGPELQLLQAGREDPHQRMVARLAVDLPALYKVLQDRSGDQHTRRNLSRFLDAAFTSNERYAAVVRNAEAMQRALELFAVSDLLTDVVVRHPEEIETLAAITSDKGSDRTAHSEPVCVANERRALAGVGALGLADSDSAKLAALRQHYRRRIFASGARDVLDGRNVYESLRETTWLADQAIAAAVRIVAPPAGFAVLALGRLGSEETDALSDADLIFVRAAECDSVVATKAAEHIVGALSAYTKEGAVFPVDARLRPRGQEGELVVTPSYLRDYFLSDAQAWEALSYTKLRLIAGSREAADQALGATEALVNRFANEANFAAEVREMRERLAAMRSPDGLHLKNAPGATYDIDFVIGTLAVRNGVRLHGTLRDRVRQLAEQGLIESCDASQLAGATEFLRAVEHAIRLAVGRSRKTLPVGGQARRAVGMLVSRMLGRDVALENELAGTLAAVRRIYERTMQ